jgi:hypothetical protein
MAGRHITSTAEEIAMEATSLHPPHGHPREQEALISRRHIETLDESGCSVPF